MSPKSCTVPVGPASDAEALEAGAVPMPWFTHDSDAASDMKCRRLIKRYGLEGYGRWWLLCEALAGTDWHRIDVSDDCGLEIMADILMYDSGDDAREFLVTIAALGLIDREMLESNGVVSSDRMVRNSLTVGRNRANGKRGGRPRKS